jgi:endonuclease/exonuclease/phosphatase family metal-dependent hydrolase
MRVLSLNVLGPNFSDPLYYPAATHAYLDAEYRWNRLRAFLLGHQGSCDLILLQEVTDAPQGTFHRIAALLSQFMAFFVPHAHDHWTNEEFVHEWMPNGNAIFIRINSFTQLQYYDVDLTYGNHGALITGTYQQFTVCIVNVHLDSDDRTAREREFEALLEACEQFTVDITLCMGDFNTGLNQAPYRNGLQQGGYSADTNTIPTFTIIEQPSDRIPIDHVMYRSSVFLQGAFTVLNSRIWHAHSSNVTRFIQNVQYCGSDHLPVVLELTI